MMGIHMRFLSFLIHSLSLWLNISHMTRQHLNNYHSTSIHIKEKIKSLHGFGPVLTNIFWKLLNTKHDLINFSCHELSFSD